jgi:hypothetical protein
LDLKLERLREKGGGEVNIKKMKKSEILKCNIYCKGMLAMFSHFTNMYAKAGLRSDECFKVRSAGLLSLTENLT